MHDSRVYRRAELTQPQGCKAQSMNKKSDGRPEAPELRPDTRLVTGGRDPFAFHGFVNPPVVHASTVLYPTAEDYVLHRTKYTYGRRGTPTSEAFEAAQSGPSMSRNAASRDRTAPVSCCCRRASRRSRSRSCR